MAQDGTLGGAGDWCTIESDPGVFTALIEKFGVEGGEVSELWSLDDDSLGQLVADGGQVYGLVFLFKWVAGHQGDSGEEGVGQKPLVGDGAPPDLFFARQVTTNACATQAILSILLKAPTGGGGGDGGGGGGLTLGPTLSNLKSFVQSFPADLRGEAIGASDEIRGAHNSFARRDAFLSDPENQKRRVAGDDDDVFHFIAYVPHPQDGCVYELDGLREGPVRCGEYGGGGGGSGAGAGGGVADYPMAWLAVARAAVQSRIEKYAATEVKFNLMAVVEDRRAVLGAKAAAISEAGLAKDGPEAAQIRADLVREEEKRAHWEVENQRRRHNYLPFCVELIRSLAGSGKLPDLTARANERQLEIRKQAMAARAAKMEGGKAFG